MGELAGGLQPSTDTRPDHGDLIDLLEERLRDLVDRYQSQRRSSEELRAQAKEQDRRINELEARVKAFDARGDNKQHVDERTLRALAKNLPAVWNDESTDMRLKQRIVRILVHEIIADVDAAS